MTPSLSPTPTSHNIPSMPKKRHQTFYSKPPSTAPHLLLSSTSSAGTNSNDAAPSVNDLLTSLRSTQISSKDSRHVPIIGTPTMPAAIRHLLDIPETPEPKPRRRQLVDANGRRLPAGPAPPRSWLETSTHAPTRSTVSSEWHDISPVSLEHLPGITFPRKRSLIDICLRTFAQQWDFHVHYDRYYLATLPTQMRMLLLSYIAHYGPESGVTYEGLKLLLRPPDDMSSEDFGGNDDFHRLDLSNSIGPFLTIKQVMNLISPPTDSQHLELNESWDESPPLQSSISLFPLHLTHLSLAAPAYSSWPSLLALANQTPTVTHLSLAYWPTPNLTPNSTATNAKMTSRYTKDMDLSSTSIYAHSLDKDYSVAAGILRRLAARWYSLEYLDVDGCLEWLPALGLRGHGKGEGVDWLKHWGRVKHINARSGILAGHEGEIPDIEFTSWPTATLMAVEKGRLEAQSLEIWIRKWARRNSGWVEVHRDPEVAPWLKTFGHLEVPEPVPDRAPELQEEQGGSSWDN